MSHIELVVEVHSRLLKVAVDLAMQRKCGFDDRSDELLDRVLEFREVLSQERRVDREERGALRELNGEQPEVPLQARVHEERTGGGIHAGEVLRVDDVLEGHLAPVVPMLVVGVLPQKRDGRLRVIRIQLGHVNIVDKVDQLGLSWRRIGFTGSLLKVLF